MRFVFSVRWEPFVLQMMVGTTLSFASLGIISTHSNSWKMLSIPSFFLCSYRHVFHVFHSSIYLHECIISFRARLAFYVVAPFPPLSP